MAEAVVTVAIDKMANLLINETVFLLGVKGEVRRLQAELKRMQCFLKDADQRQDQDERVHNWIAEIRDAAYNAEDVIDTFILKIAGKEGRRRSFMVFATFFRRGCQLYRIGMEIKAIRTNLGDVSQGMQTYGIKFSGGGEGTRESQKMLRKSHPAVEEDDVFGLEGSISETISQLKKEEKMLRVVSIVGMGGSGKTTLAKRVYNHAAVKRHFDCCAWAFVSQQFSKRDILFGILAKITTERDRLAEFERKKEEDPVEILYEFLKDKRYLVVLDDIWRVEAWDILKNAFPKNGKAGSKVLFTTRNKVVASHADPWSIPIEPPMLDEGQSWELLCKNAFPPNIAGSRGGGRPEYEKPGKAMVRKCQGLPLALVVLGGLLAAKKSLNEWEEVERNMNANLNKFQQQMNHPGGVYGILSLSYYELPYYLKPCFLYLGHFPEDWEIPKKKLIRLWIAEGFVPPQFPTVSGEDTTEDVAERYLAELVNRCMVQVGTTSLGGRGRNFCRIHDLMRDLCVSYGRDENFLDIVPPRGTTMKSTDDEEDHGLTSPTEFEHSKSTNFRRIAIHHVNVFQRCVPLVQSYPKIRSLLCFKFQQSPFLIKADEQIFIWKNFNLLRVLDLEGSEFENEVLLREIGGLILLRYLSLRFCALRTLPESIGNLQSLYTLDLRDTRVCLTNVIGKMKQLRHLLLGSTVEADQDVLRRSTLTNLETLKHIKSEHVVGAGKGIKLPNLRNLGLIFQRSEDVDAFFKSPVLKMNRLRSLKMNVQSAGVSYPILEPLSPCDRLSNLRLQGPIAEVGKQICHPLAFLPPNLCKLTLESSRLKQDPMPTLGKLQNLKILRMHGFSYIGREMVCSANGFPQLEFLELCNLYQLEDWIVEGGAMHRLRGLYISFCPELKMIPEELKSLTTLRELTFGDLSKALLSRVRMTQEKEGEDFYKVKHIPAITFLHKV
ncbi:hypothetical protein RJ640_000372 [Escallonia rubra]|uniref:Disease resistance protein At1g50180 n=1 Tax=Escallonia rubra TaxID=112253 RepID=A0AA88RNX1_9ASTE|nr:hypothetical protein RJ640_000372 [Escallonia rubra]